MTIKLSLLLSYRRIEINFTRHVISTEKLLQVACALDLRDRGVYSAARCRAPRGAFLISRFRNLVSTALRKIVRAIISRTRTRAYAMRTLHSLRPTSSRPIFNTGASSASRSPGAVGAPLWIFERGIIGSGAPFRSRDHPDMYLDTHLATSLGGGGAMAIPRADLIFVKNAPGACWRTIDTQPPSAILIFVFLSAYLFCKLSRRPSAYVMPSCIITETRRKRMTGSLRCADLYQVLSIALFLSTVV